MRYFSNSEFQTFKGCRRRWWLAYFRFLRPKRVNRVSAASLGTVIHQSLAPWYVPDGEEPVDPRETLENLLREERALVVESFADDPQAADGQLKELDKQHEFARAMIEGYVDWIAETGADADFEVIGSEQIVHYEVAPGRTLLGRLDVRIRRISDGIKLFLDHKTCQSFLDLQRSLHSTEQLPTYLILERAMGLEEGEWTEGALFNGLRKVKRTGTAKPPFYERFDKTYNHHQLEALWYRIQAQIRDIEEVEVRLSRGENPQTVVYPTFTRDCHWKCEFYPVCSMFDDGSRAEDMLESFYEVGDPLSRYPELSGGYEENHD